jgi:hypothetical protein
LFGEFSQDMTLLVRQEIRLARTELSEKASAITKRLTTVVIGGFVAYLGALTLLAGLVLLLTQVVGIPAWVSALVLGVVLAGGGYLTLRGGLRELKNIDPAPRRTVGSIKDDVRWAKELRS